MKEYWHSVFEPFLRDFDGGGATPNPDLACNRHIKFGALSTVACAPSARIFATGHYARIVRIDETNPPRLLRDRPRQGSVLLSGVSQGRVPRTSVFPSWRLDEAGGARARRGTGEPARRGDAAEQRRYMLHRAQTRLLEISSRSTSRRRARCAWILREGTDAAWILREVRRVRSSPWRAGRRWAGTRSREIHVRAACAPGRSFCAVVRGW